MSIWMWLPPLIAVVFVVGIMLALVLTKKETTRQLTATVQPQRYGRSESIMTEAERAVYPLLQWAVGKEMLVIPKVSLGAIITVPKNLDRRFVHVRQVSAHHVDFALCVIGRAKVSLVVQLARLNDEDTERYEDDQFVASALQAARIPTIWLDPKKTYMAHELKQLIQTASNSPVVVMNDAKHDDDDDDDVEYEVIKSK